MPKISIVIPSGVDFADLQLARDADGMVSFRWEPIEAICEASDVDVEVFRDSPEDNLGALLSHWYHAHLAGGGDRDPTYDDMIAEVEAEDRLGGGLSHRPWSGMMTDQGRDSSAPGPTPKQIRAARQSVGLTQKKAGELIHCSVGAWQKWEEGQRRMHPATWELFLIKSMSAKAAAEAFVAWWGEDVAADDTMAEAAEAAWTAACDWLRQTR